MEYRGLPQFRAKLSDKCANGTIQNQHGFDILPLLIFVHP